MDLIEAYYAVSRHLQAQADDYARSAHMLGLMADAMSEARMREKHPAGCHRSHPHEDMNAECERLTEIARRGNESEP